MTAAVRMGDELVSGMVAEAGIDDFAARQHHLDGMGRQTKLNGSEISCVRPAADYITRPAKIAG